MILFWKEISKRSRPDLNFVGDAVDRRSSVQKSGSRSLPEIGLLPSGREVVMKRYYRGGLMRFISKDLHLSSFYQTSFADFRSIREFLLLNYLFLKGVSVPKPIAACARFKLCKAVYRCGLITESFFECR